MEKTIQFIKNFYTGELSIFICGDDIYGYYSPEEAFATLNRLYNELLEAWTEYRKEINK